MADNPTAPLTDERVAQIAARENFIVHARQDITDLLLALSATKARADAAEAALSATRARVVELEAASVWRCFHCGEVFDNVGDAEVHFGGSQFDDPACGIKNSDLGLIGTIREQEQELRRYREEDTDLHRKIASMACEHGSALRAEEEKGYAKGLADQSDRAELLARAEAAEAKVSLLNAGWDASIVHGAEHRDRADRAEVKVAELEAELARVQAGWNQAFSLGVRHQERAEAAEAQVANLKRECAEIEEVAALRLTERRSAEERARSLGRSLELMNEECDRLKGLAVGAEARVRALTAALKDCADAMWADNPADGWLEIIEAARAALAKEGG